MITTSEAIDMLWDAARIAADPELGGRERARALVAEIDRELRAGAYAIHERDEALAVARWVRWVHGLDVSP